MSHRAFFDRLDWRDGRVLLGDLVFRLEQSRPGVDLEEDCFRLYKGRGLVDQYRRFWVQHPDFHPRAILELGVWDGASIAFWNELFHPHRHVGLDIAQRPKSNSFDTFIRSRGLEERVSTFWGVDQADAAALRSIVSSECRDTLDLVIDDGAHTYNETRAAFETIFPRVQPSGLYVIEDWAWAHWRAAQSPDHPWARKRTLTSLIVEMIEAIGSSAPLVASATIFQGFAVIERNDTEVEDSATFNLESHIVRRAKPRTRTSRALRRLARLRTKVRRSERQVPRP